MKKIFWFLLVLTNYAYAGGGRNTHVPDNFLEVLGLILMFALLIDTFRKL